jgi:hypothetical protein
MEREQIIKALVCLAGEEVVFCRECRYNGVGAFSCRKEAAKDALSLITSQEQRIKELTEENERLQKALNADISIVRVSRGNGRTAHLREIGRIKADAIRADTVRKMREMLCEGRVSNDPVVIAVNVAVKEMLEGKNG